MFSARRRIFFKHSKRAEKKKRFRFIIMYEKYPRKISPDVIRTADFLFSIFFRIYFSSCTLYEFIHVVVVVVQDLLQ